MVVYESFVNEVAINKIPFTMKIMAIFIEIKWKLVILHSVSHKRARVSITPARTKQPVKLVLPTKDTVV